MRTAGSPSRLISVAVVLIATTLGALAFTENLSIVRHLSAPGFDVQYRELAAAQTILDGGYGPDSSYAHEHVWYNPMTSWIIAAASRLSGSAAPAVVADLGPYVNASAPVALFVLVTTLFDGVTALAAVALFTFVIGTEFPFYYSATYSPWLAPESFAQAWLYLCLAAGSVAFRRNAGMWWSAICGTLLGLTFLTHTAPALLGGAVVAGLGALQACDPARRRSAAARVAVVLGIAFVVSWPFNIEILWRYHLRIINPFPSQSPSNLLDLNELPALLRTIGLPASIAAVALGLRAARQFDQGMRLLFVWLAIVLMLLAANVGRLLLVKLGVHVPPVVPAFHFFAYLMAIVAIGIGIGVCDAGAALARWFTPDRSRRAAQAGSDAGLVACALTVAIVGAGYPRYLERQDFTTLKRDAVELGQEFPADVVAWMRAQTSPGDVFLCTDDASLYVVGPAGRKVVATNRYFSNPYVDWTLRDADRRRMFEQLRSHDVAGFRVLAATYDVGFIVVTRDRSNAWLRAAGLRTGDLPLIDVDALVQLGFRQAFADNRFVVLAVRPETAAFGRGTVRRTESRGTD